MRYYYPPILNPIINLERPVKDWSLSRILLLGGTLLVAAVMLVETLSTYRIASHYLGHAYARNTHIRALAQAHEVEQLLSEARSVVLNLGQTDVTADSIHAALMAKPVTQRNRYAEVAFHAVNPEKNFLLINTGEQIWKVPPEQAAEIKFGTFARREKIEGKLEDYVQIEQPSQVYYTSVPYLGSVENMEFSVIRLSTPVIDHDKTFLGYLTLSLDIAEIQQIMTIYSSRQSPLYIFPQEKEQVRGFFFDTSGWLICESGPTSPGRSHVSIDNIRTGLQGDMGRPGFASAFRPDPQYENYWTAVTAVQAGKDGGIDYHYVHNPLESTGRDQLLYYVPIRFHEVAGRAPTIAGGIGCIDGKFLYKSTRNEIAMALTLSWAGGVLLILGAFFYLDRRISKPVTVLSEAAEKVTHQEDPGRIEISPLPTELRQLQQTVNVLLLQLQAARNETRIMQTHVREEFHRQPVPLDEMLMGKTPEQHLGDDSLSDIVGGSLAVQNLRHMIKKAASVMADVLIVGETGTGKELTADAIHRASSRVTGPFVSINCGELDENLLLDALFGHVKGAFSEAKGDRKGAFLTASGGTLHLDEIGNASPKVQQALLRALSVRVIRPLGSDHDIPFDVRVVAATNVDLLECSKEGTFREDLYYRLAVITITTPPLRQRKEDIPALVGFFLKEAARSLGRNPMELSRGALDKMLMCDWPGNVRELKNCITRALTFAEGNVLLAEHLTLNGDTGQGYCSETPVSSPMIPFQAARRTIRDNQGESILEKESAKRLDSFENIHNHLNPRQKKAWPQILAAGGTNRAQYQEAVGANISVRTAQYDLQDLVNKGLLVKSGKGPSSKYVLA